MPLCEYCQDTGKVCEHSGLWKCPGYDVFEPLGPIHTSCIHERCICPAGDLVEGDPCPSK